MTTQHERDRETGFDYRGARFYDGECGRFLSLDPLAAEFPGWSDYNYVLGNPVRFVDSDGRAPDDVILLIWATDDGHIGHAGIAVSNYKLDSDGNYVADGTYSYQDLWPASAVGVTNSGEDVVASYGNISSTTLSDLINTDVTGSEGYNPDGVLKISTSYAEDQKVLSDLSNFKKNHPKYNGQKCNCSDFASEGVRSVIESKSSNPFEVINVDQNNIGKEIIQMVGPTTTPNQLWKDTKLGLGGAVEVLKDPGKKVDNTFIEGAKGN
ncbi:MAG: RHS repeat-associated core domain-containing protein [Cyanobacteria bacterium J06649_11]